MKRKIEPKIMLRAIKHLSSDLPCRNRVYLNQMFKNIFVPIFSEAEEDYTLTYGDFNGLGKFNKQYGEDAGTKAIVDSISVIQEQLPSDTITIRMAGAGDEFIFLSPNSKIADIKNYISSASNILESSPNKYLTMSFGIVESTEASNIYDMYVLAEQRESIAKLESHSAEYSPEIMQQKLDDNLAKFFNNYRFSNKIKLDTEHITKLGKSAMKSAFDLIISDEFRQLKVSAKNSELFSPLTTSTAPLFTPSQANLLFDYITDEGEDKLADTLSKIYPTQINKLFKELILNPNSNFFDSTYYDLFFKPKINQSTYRPATIMCLEVTGIKDCNSKTSHFETDQKLAELSAEIEDSLYEICGIEFDTDIASFDESKNYIFNTKGGDFLIILGETTLSPKESFNFLSSINAVNINPMQIVASYSTDKSITYNEALNNISQDLNIKKSKLLESSLDTIETKESLDLFIADTVDFFMNYCPTSSDINSQKWFLEQLAVSLVNQAILSNKEFENEQNKKNDNEK